MENEAFHFERIGDFYMLYLLDKALSKMSDVELKAIMCDIEIPGKQKVVNYLKSFEKNAYTTQPVIDVLTGEKLNFINDMRSDGVYSWFDSEIYHFEKYNIKLDDNFIQYVLSK